MEQIALNNTQIMFNYSKSPAYLCELDQIELLNSLSKLPKMILYLGILMLLLYIVYFYWKPKSEIQIGILEAIPKMNFLITIAVVFLLIFTTLNITTEIYKTYIEPTLIGITIIGIIYIIWNERKNIKKALKQNE